MKTVSAHELQEKMGQENLNIIDVREAYEYESGHIPGSINIPLSVLNRQSSQLDKDKEYYLVCASGARSMQASFLLGMKGYRTRNMQGGLMNWRGPIK